MHNLIHKPVKSVWTPKTIVPIAGDPWRLRKKNIFFVLVVGWEKKKHEINIQKLENIKEEWWNSTDYFGGCTSDTIKRLAL